MDAPRRRRRRSRSSSSSSVWMHGVVGRPTVREVEAGPGKSGSRCVCALPGLRTEPPARRASLGSARGCQLRREKRTARCCVAREARRDSFDPLRRPSVGAGPLARSLLRSRESQRGGAVKWLHAAPTTRRARQRCAKLRSQLRQFTWKPLRQMVGRVRTRLEVRM